MRFQAELNKNGSVTRKQRSLMCFHILVSSVTAAQIQIWSHVYFWCFTFLAFQMTLALKMFRKVELLVLVLISLIYCVLCCESAWSKGAKMKNLVHAMDQFQIPNIFSQLYVHQQAFNLVSSDIFHVKIKDVAAKWSTVVPDLRRSRATPFHGYDALLIKKKKINKIL